ncbi:hypothetical protein ACS126_03765 [Sphingobacterium lactis]|uniref:hypothetical protein n=1 Tax=Sphingobacterium TaxID=28453 RepID=UPI0021A5DFC2|nr:hypothetical protein [Sphingobacterium hotanense]MCT1525307.1 hypothetical protein [Sphingobacterium hotanense]
MKTYEVVMTFTYTGTFLLKADSRKKAQSTMEQNSNMELTRDTMETINSEGIDWQFEVKPQKAIISVLRTKRKGL